jgi:hypothetical protein
VKPILAAAVVVVQLALISYSVGVVQLQRRRRASPGVLGFLTAGVAFDVAATTCMILGTERGPFTLHGILGYTALAAMLVDTLLVWRHRRRCGASSVPRPLHLYSRAAYAWWVVAYVTGAALVAMSRSAG